MRARRDKLLHDVEKSDRLSREAKRRNRHSWGGNINGKIFLYKKILTYLTSRIEQIPLLPYDYPTRYSVLMLYVTIVVSLLAKLK